MDDTIDDTMGADEEEAETEQVVNQVLDELGLETEGKLGYVPRGSVQNGEKNRQEAEEQDDLESRLENLRK
jgi:charged multivesicular body protein 2A